MKYVLTFSGTEYRIKSFNTSHGHILPKKIKRKEHRGARVTKGPNVFSGMDDFQEVLRTYM